MARHDAPEPDTARHTLTVQQAADMFAKLGSPRSPRSVQRFCEQKLLDAIPVTRDNGTPRYFIDPQSVERYAAELKQLQDISQIGNNVSRHDAPERDMARHNAPKVEPPVDLPNAPETDREVVGLRERMGSLEKENFQLRIDLSARVVVINQMADERRGFFDQITAQSRELGRLETRMEMLDAPKEIVTRHDATDVTERGTATIVTESREAVTVEMPVVTPASPAAEPRPHFLRSLFGGG